MYVNFNVMPFLACRSVSAEIPETMALTNPMSMPMGPWKVQFATLFTDFEISLTTKMHNKILIIDLKKK